jgi:hypothetical protein
MTDKEIRFVKWIKSQCKKYGVKCSLRNVKYLKLSGNIRCSGYFDDTTDKKPTLVVSMNRKDWIEILVHEYCHLTQWSEGIDLWGKAGESLAIIEEWLGGNEVKDIDYHLGIARDLELDNERRTAKLLKAWDLGIDIEHYIRKANAYVQFYNYMYKTRKWCSPKNSPYTNERLIAQMPKRFNMRYKKMSKQVEKIFTQENI